MDSLRSRDTEVLVTKLLNVSKVMKDDLSRTRRSSKVARVQHELEVAIAEQDFEKAAQFRCVK